MPQVTLPDGMPTPMRNLRRDDVGRPVPFFVQWIDGKPDFRIMNPNSYTRCIQEGLCWLCGQRIRRTTKYPVFVAGPMCVVNGTSAEPPSHYDCAAWSARACPFLVNPVKVRREAGIPEDKVGVVGGIAITRNPGVTALIAAERWHLFPDVRNGGVLVHFEPHSVEWITEGRAATSEEVLASIDSGLPALIQMAEEQDAEEGEAGAMEHLQRLVYKTISRWVPFGPWSQFDNITKVLS